MAELLMAGGGQLRVGRWPWADSGAGKGGRLAGGTAYSATLQTE